jgi:nucleotide-binding universal stress UspA family protein
MKILLALDGSEESQRPIEAIRSRTWPGGTIVRVLSVAPTAFGFAGGAAPQGVLVEQLTTELETAAAQAVATGMTALASSGLALESRIRRGEPRSESVEEAKEWHSDLIMMGSHGHSRLHRLLLGSVAEYVVRHAPCSVEIARGPERQDGKGASPPRPRPVIAP